MDGEAARLRIDEAEHRTWRLLEITQRVSGGHQPHGVHKAAQRRNLLGWGLPVLQADFPVNPWIFLRHGFVVVRSRSH
jgi:hypothetical protein